MPHVIDIAPTPARKPPRKPPFNPPVPNAPKSSPVPPSRGGDPEKNLQAYQIGSRFSSDSPPSSHHGGDLEKNPQACQTSEYDGLSFPGHAVIHNMTTKDYLVKDLSVKRINEIHKHLWWVGRPFNFRPLHRQKMMRREIVITEDPTMHLVWCESTIFIKPLPAYLLDWDFFQANLCKDEELFKYAVGFLLSYSRIILHKSDHQIAVENRLLPVGMDWESWCVFINGLDSCMHKDDYNKRYRYGELRLRRLNHIYRFCRGIFAYHSTYTQYDVFFQKNFGWLLLLFAYATIILAAMQVVLATPNVTEPFKQVSYVFGILSILLVVMGTFFIVALFLFFFTYNMVATLKYRRKYRKGLKQLTFRDATAKVGGMRSDSIRLIGTA